MPEDPKMALRRAMRNHILRPPLSEQVVPKRGDGLGLFDLEEAIERANKTLQDLLQDVAETPEPTDREVVSWMQEIKNIGVNLDIANGAKQDVSLQLLRAR